MPASKISNVSQPADHSVGIALGLDNLGNGSVAFHRVQSKPLKSSGGVPSVKPLRFWSAQAAPEDSYQHLASLCAFFCAVILGGSFFLLGYCSKEHNAEQRRLFGCSKGDLFARKAADPFFSCKGTALALTFALTLSFYPYPLYPCRLCCPCLCHPCRSCRHHRGQHWDLRSPGGWPGP